jgi:hypothetical protein
MAAGPALYGLLSNAMARLKEPAFTPPNRDWRVDF